MVKKACLARSGPAVVQDGVPLDHPELRVEAFTPFRAPSEAGTEAVGVLSSSIM